MKIKKIIDTIFNRRYSRRNRYDFNAVIKAIHPAEKVIITITKSLDNGTVIAQREIIISNRDLLICIIRHKGSVDELCNGSCSAFDACSMGLVNSNGDFLFQECIKVYARLFGERALRDDLLEYLI